LFGQEPPLDSQVLKLASHDGGYTIFCELLAFGRMYPVSGRLGRPHADSTQAVAVCS
jgi:hypothetical protein